MVKSIAIDAMGGDFGPQVTVPATVTVASKNPDMEFTLVGDEQKLKPLLERAAHTNLPSVNIHHASEMVAMNESPTHALRRKKDSSMRVAMDLVKQGLASACVSAGNTGALTAIAHVILRPLPGIHRPAIISQIPTVNKHVNLLDLGANVECSAMDLFQFGVMGTTFVKYMEGIENPSVALLNIGVEEIKGNQTIKETAALLEASELNYQGYIEGDRIFSGEVNVVVCDGFSGNVVIKTGAGVSRFIQNTLREEFERNLMSKLTGLMARPVLSRTKLRIDPRVYNGAALIGLTGSVIKSHGAADQVAFQHALRKAVSEVNNEVPARINERIAEITSRAL